MKTWDKMNAKEKALEQCRAAVEAWTQYETDEGISGAELVDWFRAFRENCKEALTCAEDENGPCIVCGAANGTHDLGCTVGARAELDARFAADLKTAEPVNVICYVDGGLVQGIRADGPGVTVDVFDVDREGETEEEEKSFRELWNIPAGMSYADFWEQVIEKEYPVIVR